MSNPLIKIENYYVVALREYNPYKKLQAIGDIPTYKKPKKSKIYAFGISDIFIVVNPKNISWWIQVVPFRINNLPVENVSLSPKKKKKWYIPSVFVVPIQSQLVCDISECLNFDINEIYKNMPTISSFERKYFPLIYECYKDQNLTYVVPNRDKVNIFSYVTFQYLDKLMLLGYRRPLVREDIWMEPFNNNLSIIETRINDRRKLSQKPIQLLDTYSKISSEDPLKPTSKPKHKGFLSMIFMSVFKKKITIAIFLKGLQDIVGFASPFLLGKIIDLAAVITTQKNSILYGVGLSFLLFIIKMVQSLCLNIYFDVMVNLGTQIRAILLSIIYKKMLKLNSSAFAQTSGGDQLNLVSVDVVRIQDSMVYINVLWSSPFQILFSVIYLGFILNLAIIPGLIVLILFIPFNFGIGVVIKKIQNTQLKIKDQRLRLMNEVVSGIRVVKLYAWEKAFMKKIEQLRKLELNNIRKLAILNSIVILLWEISPIIVTLVSFIAYIYLGNDLNASTAFVSLSIFNIMRFPLSALPDTINSFIQMKVSVKRIEKYLGLNELDDTRAKSRDEVFNLKNASFSWNVPCIQPTLSNITFSVDENELIAVIGRLGSGKSTLLASILGEVYKIEGMIEVAEKSIAYVPQSAWIQNMSLKNNILFNKDFNSKKYDAVLENCCLTNDLKLLPDHDETEIGEKGVNLSGGQKQRVSLARAVYSEADVYLLDDPLSAVDSHVGKDLFENVISNNGCLKNKTRILATHKLDILPNVDKILVLDQGKITHFGTYSQLKENGFDFGILENVEQELKKEHADVEMVPTENKTKKEKKDGKLITTESSKVGKVLLKIYHKYFKALTYPILIGFTIFLLIGQGFSLASQLLLASFSSNGITAANRKAFFSIYGGTLSGQVFFTFFSNIIFALGAYLASKRLHKKLLNRVFHLGMSFFEQTPQGRIINIFSADIDVLDVSIPRSFRMFCAIFIGLVVLFGGILYTLPFFIIPLVLLLIVYFLVQNIYVSSSRQIQRMESVSKSPIFSQFIETINGVTSIRAYEKINIFIETFNQRVYNNLSLTNAKLVANRWVALRLETIGNIAVFFSALLSIISAYFGIISTGNIGFAISSTSGSIQILNWLIRMRGDLESNIVSVERIYDYFILEMEANWDLESIDIKDKVWPSQGIIKYNKFSARYRPELDYSLRGISFETKSFEKIGIVGRTGAGKSSLIMSLFRVIEASEGNIEIDNVDISKLGLHQLRGSLSVIPQDPFLFNNTVRKNLDPFDHYMDDEIWQALKKSYLFDYIDKQENGLEFIISENGDNLSAGQKQLICLSRALLKNSKILVLDEATASVDVQTDELIQKTIRESFTECTIITIAHRLNTIIDYDRIAVFKGGYLFEFDTPQSLLNNPESLFYSMAKDAKLI